MRFLISITSVYYCLCFFISVSGDTPCIPRKYDGNSVVCVCNSTYCDTIEAPQPPASGRYTLYSSSLEGLRFDKTEGSFQSAKVGEASVEIALNRSVRYQEVKGFGAAFTDSAGINILSLSEGAQEKLLRSYFSTSGLEYNIGRVPIGGTDFSTHTYSYDDIPGDDNLTQFSLTEEDYVYKIPLIKQAREISTPRGFQLFASVWSAPKWMKTNNEFYGKGSLKEEYYQTWANYFLRFFEEYEKYDVHFWAVTAQNEPTDGNIEGFFFNCMGWTAESQTKFVAENLGPTLKNSQFNEVEIMIVDDSRHILPHWPKVVMSNSTAAQYVSGIAVHWYVDTLPALVLTETHNLFPDLYLLNTEACAGYMIVVESVKLGDWNRGELYATDIIEDVNNWVTGWVDWNLALDLQGGPNWAKNFVDAAIIINATADEFYKQPMYYSIGHFSKFIVPGAQRIGLTSTSETHDVSSTAFVNPDNSVVVVLQNKLDTETTVTVSEEDVGSAMLTLPPRSLQTLIYGSG